MLCFVAVPTGLIESPTGTLAVARDAIYSSLDAVPAASKPRAILAFDPAMIQRDDADPVKLTITEARNGVPYREPVAVIAAGGYVVRAKDSEAGLPVGAIHELDLEALELLLIYRRGVWDLPKGKLDAGESIREAALREVREEIGAENLQILRPLGTTVHGYPLGDRFAVKTTHWFLMETFSSRFVPQADEQIEQVRWVPWAAASKMIGYDTIRAHMRRITLGEFNHTD